MAYNDIHLIHTAPLDERHKVEVYENLTTGTRWFVPLYSRTGRSWARYRDRNAFIHRKSYNEAVKVIRQRGTPTV